ncbi:hypothetical protein H5T88_00475 [bacterium]|nr:hypothetical protein [bacterium]
MNLTPEEVWNAVVKEVKERKFFPPLWQALDSAVPLALEEDCIVLGFKVGTFHLRTHIETGSNRVLIEEVLGKIMNKPYTIKVVEASTPEEWQAIREREEMVEEVEVEEFARRRGTTSLLREWMEFSLELHRLFSSLQQRSLPQVKASFLYQVLPLIVKKKRELHREDEASKETNEKALARLLDRLSSWTGIPNTIIAYELIKWEKEGRA